MIVWKKEKKNIGCEVRGSEEEEPCKVEEAFENNWSPFIAATRFVELYYGL